MQTSTIICNTASSIRDLHRLPSSSSTPPQPPPSSSGTTTITIHVPSSGTGTAAAAPAIVSSSTSSASTMRPPPPPPPPRIKLVDATTTKLEEPTSSIPDLEFDGTTVLCRVCGDKASGFHYGVHSCEGCKGFFRRSIQQKIQYRPCTKNQQCSILRINRNRCQYCRLKKCIAVGMSRDAVRFGRVPKREKARILAAMQQSSNSRSMEKAVAAELDDEQRLLTTVVRAHVDTCDFTREKIEPMLQHAREQPSYTACPPTLACPLNPNPQPLTGQQELLQDFSKRFSPAIRGVVEFAKRLPGFSLLSQDDQVTLLKAGVFEVLLVRLACMFDSQTSSMICLNGQVLKRDSIHNSSNARFLMDSMFDFAERINSFRLSDAEIGLFCSVVVIAADRPGLRNVELIEKMHNKLKHCLQVLVAQNHQNQPHILDELMRKVPDLRTLNTLHSEKLLAFKMTEQQQMMQQQQQQQQLNNWNSPMEDETNSKSPATLSWSSSSEDAIIDEVKSPLGSVSSTESMCSNEMISNEYVMNNHNHHHHHHNHNHHQQHLKITPISAPVMIRKLESPSDSGIESGAEKVDKPTSVCSSPRSSVDDQQHQHHHYQQQQQQNHHHHHIVEDMPVLKRVLQAPPLYDTNSLMDEAYKPHKKFRALRNNKDSAEAEPAVIISPTPPPIPQVIIQHHQSYHQQQQQQQQSPPHHHHHHGGGRDGGTSGLSSSHLMLAKILMEEGPRMTAEQMKNTEVIHSYVMRGDASSAQQPQQSSASPHITASPTGGGGGGCPYSQHHRNKTSSSISNGAGSSANSLLLSTQPIWPTTSVITSARSTASSPMLLHPPQSPHSTSPAPPPQSSSPLLLMQRSPRTNSTCSNSTSSSSSSSSSTCSPRLMELQVDVQADSQQPLNLSKKSPSPSPRPPKIVTLEV